jgi:hypothetical protein
LATTDCPRGWNTLTLAAAGPAGSEAVIERDLIVEPYEAPGELDAAAARAGQVALTVDFPLSGGAEIESPARISGWCFAQAGVESVRAILDARRVFDTLFPALRPEVWKRLENRDALLSGFELELDAEDCPPGEHTLTILANTSDGRRVGVSGAFVCRPAPPPGVPAGARAELSQASEPDS